MTAPNPPPPSEQDKLRMDYINSLPQPFMARLCGGGTWPIHDIEVQTALMRIDVCGKLEVKKFSEAMEITDAAGTVHDPDTFWTDYASGDALTTPRAGGEHV